MDFLAVIDFCRGLMAREGAKIDSSYYASIFTLMLLSCFDLDKLH